MDVRRFYGGDLQGVLEKLDYLQELGVEVVYFNPLFVSPSNHKYDIQDYDYIDPHLGVIVEDGGEILPEGVIVTTKDRDGTAEEYTCDGAHEFTKPLAVLVNGSSASASEVFAAAVKDYGIGTIVGETTFGKGVVQDVIGLRDGSSVKITTAEYFPPSGESINKKGVKPDVEIEFEQDPNDPEADNQLEKALEIVRQ